MDKATFKRYQNYLLHPFGQIDDSLFDLSIAKDVVNNKHFVTFEIEGKKYVFLRSRDRSWAGNPVLLTLIDDMGSKKGTAFANAAAGAKAFSFRHTAKGRVSFSNAHLSERAPGSRNVAIAKNQKVLFTDEEREQLKSFSFSTQWYNNSLLVSFDDEESRKQNRRFYPFDYIKAGESEAGLLSLIDEDGLLLGFEIVGSKDEPAEFSEDTVDKFVWTSREEGGPVSLYYHSPNDLQHRYIGRYLKDIRLNLYHGLFGSYTGANKGWRRIFRDGDTAINDTTPSETEAFLIGLADRLGFHPTGRLWLGPDNSLITVENHRVDFGDAEDGGQESFRSVGVVTPHVAPGRSLFAIEGAGCTIYVECDCTFEGGHDLFAIRLDDIDNYVYSLTRTYWNGGVIVWPHSYAQERFQSALDLIEPTWKLRPADPLARASEILPSLYKEGRITGTAHREAAHGGNPTTPVAMLDRATHRRIQAGDEDPHFYLPVVGFLNGTKVTFEGATSVSEDLSLLTLDGVGEGANWEETLETDSVTDQDSDRFGWVDNDDELFQPFPDEDTDGEDGGAKRTTVLRHSVVEMESVTSFLSFNSDSVIQLTNGQGVFKPERGAGRDSYLKFAGEMGARSLGAVVYDKPIKIPFNISDRLIMARDYAKAKKKACQTNDWDKQEYVKGVKWGAVKRTMNDRGSLKEVFDLSDVSSIEIHDSFYPLKPVSLTYVPGSKPAEFVMKMSDQSEHRLGPEEDDLFWEALAVGATMSGISLAALSASWGYPSDMDQSDVDEATRARADIVSGQSDALSRIGKGPYQYNPATYAIAGYPDVRYMVTDDAYKAMIASVIVYERVGAGLLSQLLAKPNDAIEAYIAASMNRYVKLSERYGDN